MRNWTFGQKVGAGFALAVTLALLVSGISIWALRTVVASKDAVIERDMHALLTAQRMALASSRKSTNMRGYFLAQQSHHLDAMNRERATFGKYLTELTRATGDAEAVRLLDDVEKRSEEHDVAAERLIAQTRSDRTLDIDQAFEREITPRRESQVAALDAFAAYTDRQLVAHKEAASKVADDATSLLALLTALLVVLSMVIATLIVRALGRQVGGAVVQVQSSSAELQASANQQVSATKQQAVAMTEINTTITELLASSRQIAESAQRVSRVAEHTVGAANQGDATVERAQKALVGIRKQVDLIVSHMLELGKKSQQIGSVLDIVSELAEQTNILAINATIEAVGAGEAGRRFSVVADEIRKLADRVTGSTKEIRALIDDVRNSVNATVMTTETGSKAVDAGAKQFEDVTQSFKQIAELLATTMEAAREIGLSTKQQATAVEQVNIAVNSVAQATRETEASSTQTLQTASQLALLSRDLLRIVKAEDRMLPQGA